MACLLPSILSILLFLAARATSITTVTYPYPSAGGLFTYVKASVIAADASQTTFTGVCTPYLGFNCDVQRDYTVTAGPETYAVDYVLHSESSRAACSFGGGDEAWCTADGNSWNNAGFLTFTMTVTAGEDKLPGATGGTTQGGPSSTKPPPGTTTPKPSSTKSIPSSTSEVPVTKTFSGESGFVTVTSLVPTTISPHSGTSTASSSGDSGLSPGAKGGIAVGVILAVAAIGGAIAAFLLYQRRKKRGDVPETTDPQDWKPEHEKYQYNELEAKHVSALSNGMTLNEPVELDNPPMEPLELQGSPVPEHAKDPKGSES